MSQTLVHCQRMLTDSCLFSTSDSQLCCPMLSLIEPGFLCSRSVTTCIIVMLRKSHLCLEANVFLNPEFFIRLGDELHSVLCPLFIFTREGYCKTVKNHPHACGLVNMLITLGYFGSSLWYSRDCIFTE